jgi:hypothetical protein
MRTPALALLAFALALPGHAQGRKEAPAAKAQKAPRWDGEWSLAPEDSDALEAAIEAHLQDQNFAMKLFWKKKLQKACQSWPSLDLTGGDAPSFLYGRELPVEFEPGATTTTWKRKDGERFQVRRSGEGGRLTLAFQGDGYALEHAFTLRKDGETLAIQATYTHPKLANPFTYKLVFKRNG